MYFTLALNLGLVRFLNDFEKVSYQSLLDKDVFTLSIFLENKKLTRALFSKKKKKKSWQCFGYK